MNFDEDETPRASMYLPDQKEQARSHSTTQPSPVVNEQSVMRPSEPSSSRQRPPPLPNFLQFVTDSTNAASIAERAWMMKMANEMSRRYEEERGKRSFGMASPGGEDPNPPPAYAR